MSKDELTLFTKSELFINYVNLQKELKKVEKDLDDQWKKLQQSMEDNDITKVDGDWGSITLASRKNYTYTDDVSEDFMKSVIDTTKVSAHYTLTGELPEGVAMSETKYLTKKFK